jgi:hypothetical protein
MRTFVSFVAACTLLGACGPASENDVAAGSSALSQDGGLSLIGGMPYQGGAVLDHVQVIEVVWGTGSYQSFVTSTQTPNVPSFYQGILASPYADLLAEYKTPTQSIARGTFVGRVTITPSTKATSLDDTMIQTELAAQIKAAKLPAPFADKVGNPQTYYAIYFPKGITVKRGGATSCAVANGFCQYHAVLPKSGTRPASYYGVHPDMQPGSGCDLQCGSAVGPFALQTAVASQALVDAITDPDFPRAFYSMSYGEIGDVCSQRAEVTGGDGVAYTVQSAYSVAQTACVTSPPGVPSQTGDFAMTLGPSSATVVQGSGTSTLVSTTFVAGVALPVSFAITGAPPGMTASTLVPAVKAGGATTLVIATAPNTAPGTYTLTVTGKEGAKTHAASFTVTVLADFALTATANVALSAGKTATATVGVSGGADPVTLAVAGLPVGVTSSLSPATLSPNTSSKLTFTASPKATFGPATVSVTAKTAKGVNHTTSIALVVSGDSFALALSPTSITIPAGSAGSVTVATSIASGASEPVSFVLSNLAPVHGSSTFASSTIASGTSTTLTFHMKSTAMAGTTSYWVTATAPTGPARMASVAVTVLNDDFAFGAVAPAQITMTPGTSKSITGSTSLAYGKSQPITLSVEGVPSGLTAVVTPKTIAPGGSYSVTFSALPKAVLVPGAWTVSVVGTGPTAQHATIVLVNTLAK